MIILPRTGAAPATQPGPPGPGPSDSPAIGAVTMIKVSEGDGTNPNYSAAINTQPTGSMLFVFFCGYTNNNAVPTDNYGNTYEAIGTIQYVAGYSDAFCAQVYACTSLSGGDGLIVKTTASGTPTGELSCPIIEVTNATSYQIAGNYPTASPGDTTSLTTSGPSVMVSLWMGDGSSETNTATVGSPWSVEESYLTLPTNSAVQCAMAAATMASAGAYACDWTWTPAQGAILFNVAVQ